MSPTGVSRREAMGIAFGAAMAAGLRPAAAKEAGDRLFVPGYETENLAFAGAPIRQHPHAGRNLPADYAGPVRLLTRVDPSGGMAQALFPVSGHDVAISPDGRLGVFAAMRGSRFCAFDADTLDLVATAKARRRGWQGGGHGVFVRDGLIAMTERAPKRGYRGAPEPHYGWITLRDAESLKIVAEMNCHGVDPHEIRLLADGQHVAVANYGSTPAEGEKDYGAPRHIVEPSITIVNLETGRLADKLTSPSRINELRHLCLASDDLILAVQARLGPPGADAPFLQEDAFAYAPEQSGQPADYSYLPAPLVRAERGGADWAEIAPPDLSPLMRHGLSIEFDETIGEAIATFPASHRIVAFDALSGRISKVIDTSRLGLDHPCGLAMLADGARYAVTGYRRGLFVFKRGSHRLDHARHVRFFGHSHIAAG